MTETRTSKAERLDLLIVIKAGIFKVTTVPVTNPLG
jgi:hypothetical protein